MQTVRLDDGLVPDERAQRAHRPHRGAAGRALGRGGHLGPLGQRARAAGARWACRTCSSTWCSRAPSGARATADRAGARGARRLPRRLHRPRPHQLPGARPRRRPAARGRHPHRPGAPAAAARRGPRAWSATWCSRRSTASRTRPTTSCSSCTPRRSGRSTPTGTPSSARAETVGALIGRRPPGLAPARATSAATASSPPPGNVDHEQLLTVLEREGWFEGPSASRRCRRRRAGRRGARRDPARGARHHAGAHRLRDRYRFRYADPRRYALAMLINVFGGGMSSRLFQRVREELGLAYAVYAYHQFYQVGGAAGRVRRHPAGHRGPGGRAPSCEEFARLAARGAPGRRSWPTARQQLKGQIMLSLESPQSRMHRLAGVGAARRPLPPAGRDAGGDRRRERRGRCAAVARGVLRPGAADDRPAGDRRSDTDSRRATSVKEPGHDHRRSEGDQDQREPHRAGAGRRRVAGRRGPHRLRRAGRRARQRLRRRGLRRRRAPRSCRPPTRCGPRPR